MGCLKARPKVYIRSKYMADKEKRGLVARWLLGKERSEDYARSTLPTSRWALFWDILKGRFGKLVLVNLIMVVTILPLAAVIFMRYLEVGMNGSLGPYGAGLGVGYPVLPDLSGYAESAMFRTDLIWFGLMIPAAAIAAEVGNARSANVVMLGAMCRLFGFDKEKMVQAVTDCVPEKFAETNLRAFALGYEKVK